MNMNEDTSQVYVTVVGRCYYSFTYGQIDGTFLGF